MAMNLILINAPFERYGNKRTKDSEGKKEKQLLLCKQTGSSPFHLGCILFII